MHKRSVYSVVVGIVAIAAAGLVLLCPLFPCAEPLPESGTLKIPRWQPRDLSFHSDTPCPNPFLVPFSASFEGPRNIRFKVPGFHDGDNTWKVRAAPSSLGEWRIQTESSDPALNGRKAAFTCVPNEDPNQHGQVLVDREHPHHFVYEDGARHFPMGYECDWLWALDLKADGGAPALPTLKPFLDKLAAHGFNFIMMNAYAHDTTWMPGKTGDDDYGPPPMYAWEGDNDAPDHERFNLEFWRHYDRVIQAMHERNIQAHIMVKVFNKKVNWPKRGSPQDLLYTRWVFARYSAYPNVIFDFSKEAYKLKDEPGYKIEHLKFMREMDGWGRLLTAHDDDALYDAGAYDGLLDFQTDQQHGKLRETLLKQRARRAWPVVNAEFGYEHGLGGPEDKTYRVTTTPEENCLRAWDVCMAGGYIAYYYTYTAWDYVRPQDTPPGYALHKRLRDFFEGTGYWLMSPADELVSEGCCLANPGKEYVVFQREAKPFTLEVKGAARPLKAEWLQPLTGEKKDGGEVGNGSDGNGSARQTPPEGWRGDPAALRVGAPPAK